MKMKGALIVVRGAGDIATGVIQKFYRAGMRVMALETDRPMAIRRTVSLSEAVYDGIDMVEDVRCELLKDVSRLDRSFERGVVPLIVDPNGECIKTLKPDCVVDAIIAKRNLGTRIDMARTVIGIGPGFTAGADCHVVIESMRGHDLGRLIFSGSARPNTGIPGELGGKSSERVIHAPCTGVLWPRVRIGDVVEAGDTILEVGGEPCRASFRGRVRGLIRGGFEIERGTKVADVDPRTDIDYLTISDKARLIGGSALEAYLYREAWR